MNDVTSILKAMERGENQAAAELLPLVYDELRRLASQKLAKEKAGQTLQPTALVHEAYLRLVGPANVAGFANRRHFFGAASEAMRRILVDQARRKAAEIHGGELRRHSLDQVEIPVDIPSEDILTINESLEALAREQPLKAEVVKLHFFLGCTLDEVSQLLEIAPATVDRYWTYSRAWLKQHITEGEEKS
ncbi:MAG: ECF-type sigma factor [Gemmatales bacterium]